MSEQQSVDMREQQNVKVQENAKGVQACSSDDAISDIKPQDIIFGSVYASELTPSVSDRRNKLLSSFPDSVYFENEYVVLFIMIKHFHNMCIDENFLRIYMQANKKMISDYPSIDLSDFENGLGEDMDTFGEFENSCIVLFNKCMKSEYTDNDFNLAVETYKQLYATKKASEACVTGMEILSESGIRVGRQSLQGYADAKRFIMDKFSALDRLKESKVRKGIIVYGENDDSTSTEDSRVKFITSFGIPSLDKALGGLYGGDFCSILAPAKGGKSRFCVFLEHNAIVNCGCNVVNWSVENGAEAWEALIRARHFDFLYNSKVTDASVKRIINNDMIRKDILKGEMRDLEEASWTDLKTNSHYGRIANIDEDFTPDTFLEVLDDAVKRVNANFVCIDYLQLMTPTNGRQNPNEVVAEAYKKTLQYLKSHKIAGIFPGQFKQTAVSDMGKGDAPDTRTIGGVSFEVIKTPDINLGLYATEQDLASGVAKILSIPSRNSAPFDDIQLLTDLGASNFIEAQY